MAYIRLINASGKIIKIGDPVKLHAKKPKSFDYAELGSIVIGTAAERVSNGNSCTINLIGTVLWENVLNKPPREPQIIISTTPPLNPAVNDKWIVISET